MPEALFGFEYEQSISDTQKFYAKLEYYPEFADFGEYRLVADAGWEIELVQALEPEPQDLGQRPVRQHAERRRAAPGELLGAAAAEAVDGESARADGGPESPFR